MKSQAVKNGQDTSGQEVINIHINNILYRHINRQTQHNKLQYTYVVVA